jgi:hypothetical protein
MVIFVISSEVETGSTKDIRCPVCGWAENALVPKQYLL